MNEAARISFIICLSSLLFSTPCLSLVTSNASAVPTRQCIKIPPNAPAEDSHYKLGVSGDPDFFLPGEIYTVSLNSIDNGEGPIPFMGFKIWAELDKGKDSKEDSRKQTVGTFQAFDAQTKIDDKCFPAITNASAHPKVEVQVIWNPPQTASEYCINICARAGPLSDNADSWSILVRKLCAAPVAPSGFPRQMPVVEPCCACDEAKYEVRISEVTFEGLWSRNTHPRDFPPESAQAHFGDIIGASHTAHYRVWQEGRVASHGLKRLADDGATTALEKELKAESEHIRTIIKARGISWQPEGTAGNRSTFAVFRVDAKHHLVSLASKMSPSPDWFVGVSALELCNTNCTWREAATLALFPYDAGTDDGVTYTSPRSPSLPLAAVRGVREWPSSPRSPFYPPQSSAAPRSLLRPFAMLRLNRQRLYEKNCDGPRTLEGEPGPAEGSNVPAGTGAGACSVGAWGAWGACSVTCGAGRRARQRHYAQPARARADHCREPLSQHEPCRGPRRHCRAPTEYEPEPAERSGPCALSAWGPWSPCAGCGVRARSRHYVAPRAHKRCHVGYRARTQLHQTMPCDMGPCQYPTNLPPNVTLFNWSFIDNPKGTCRVSEWSAWSPCAAPCGTEAAVDARAGAGVGRRMRTRLPLARDADTQRALHEHYLDSWNRRFAELQSIAVEPKRKNSTTQDIALAKSVKEYLDGCQHTLTMQEALCEDLQTDCKLESIPKSVCQLPMSVGPCRAYEERWFFDQKRGVCEPFGYTGCGGNGNNFKTYDDCRLVCGAHNVTFETDKNLTDSETRVARAATDQEYTLLDNSKVACLVGPWQGWAPCTGDCNYAYRLNFRIVTRKPSSNIGSPCPDVIKSRPCVPKSCRLATPDDHLYLNTVVDNYDV